ncbi:hypothetical protein RND81_11G070000 [Saponaria officinalis]|uniref:Uncharacterized protein n=1 Tax=Saponaria officinalis TaxID=3572 RepID=A0AAW1HIT3_SAPOF
METYKLVSITFCKTSLALLPFLQFVSSSLFVLSFCSSSVQFKINGGAASGEEKKLRAEIKRLLKESGSLTQPSTFAQAAKLRRMASAKEKELAKHQEQQMLERKTVYDPYMKYVTPVKALTYHLLTVWIWKSSVAAISKELVQPIGTVLSWKSGGDSVDKVTVSSLLVTFGSVPHEILCPITL